MQYFRLRNRDPVSKSDEGFKIRNANVQVSNFRIEIVEKKHKSRKSRRKHIIVAEIFMQMRLRAIGLTWHVSWVIKILLTRRAAIERNVNPSSHRLSISETRTTRRGKECAMLIEWETSRIPSTMGEPTKGGGKTVREGAASPGS